MLKLHKGCYVKRHKDHLKDFSWTQACNRAGKEPDGIFLVEKINKSAVQFKGVDNIFLPEFFVKVVIARPIKRDVPNPQLVTVVDKLFNGVFRVHGVFKDKARVCIFEELPRVDRNTEPEIRVSPLNRELRPLKGSRELWQNKIDTRAISIMCLERFN